MLIDYQRINATEIEMNGFNGLEKGVRDSVFGFTFLPL